MDKNLRRRVSLSILLFITTMLMALSGHAQTHSVTGTIISAEDSKPMPGVSIRVSGAATGTVSATDGTYSILAKPTDVLIFSFISYTTQQIYVGSSTAINVKMSQSVSNLNEVVVIGYGNSRR